MVRMECVSLSIPSMPIRNPQSSPQSTTRPASLDHGSFLSPPLKLTNVSLHYYHTPRACPICLSCCSSLSWFWIYTRGLAPSQRRQRCKLVHHMRLGEPVIRGPRPLQDAKLGARALPLVAVVWSWGGMKLNTVTVQRLFGAE